MLWEEYQEFGLWALGAKKTGEPRLPLKATEAISII
jgi:hypothetical protein